MTTSLELMLTLQDELNEEIVPNWKKVRTVQEFETECILEIAEMIECVPHKWWKHYSEEKLSLLNDKIKLELVDVLHFALSAVILDGSVNEKVLVIALKSADVESYKKLLDLVRSYNFLVLIYQLNNLASLLKFDLFGFYIAKYTLNRIRLLSGYKDGTYKKSENVEDNEILLKHLPDKSLLTVLSNPLNKKSIEQYKIMIKNIYEEFGIPEEYRKIDIF